MNNDSVQQAVKVLKNLKTQDPSISETINFLGDAFSFRDVRNSTGVAIGRKIHMVVNHFDLPAASVGALMEAARNLGGIPLQDSERYQLTTYLTDKTRDFVGRDYVFDAIGHFLTSHPNGYLVIHGEPGLGKSAVLAEYVRRSGCIAHFNVRAQGITSPRQFLENICAQVITYAGLPYTNLPANATQDGAFLARLLNEASAKLAGAERLIIAVDALDEVDLGTHSLNANILYLPPVLPQGVYFVMTRRPVDVPLVVQTPLDFLDLMAHKSENRLDIERYLRRSAAQTEIQSWIERQSTPTVDYFVSELAVRSQNNFMYLRYILPQIKSGVYQNYDLKNLPSGLKEYYKDHWRRMGMETKPIPRAKIHIIYVLCEVELPVSRQLITEFVNQKLPVDQLDVQDVLDEWAQFLNLQDTPDGPRYSIYHASFRDFLYGKDIIQASGIRIPDIHAMISDNLWGDLYDEG